MKMSSNFFFKVCIDPQQYTQLQDMTLHTKMRFCSRCCLQFK